MAQAVFRLDDEMENRVESRLVYGQSKSEWYRYAVQTALQNDEVLDELFEPYEFEKRQEFVRQAVSDAVNQAKNDASRGTDN